MSWTLSVYANVWRLYNEQHTMCILCIWAALLQCMLIRVVLKHRFYVLFLELCASPSQLISDWDDISGIKMNISMIHPNRHGLHIAYGKSSRNILGMSHYGSIGYAAQVAQRYRCRRRRRPKNTTFIVV